MNLRTGKFPEVTSRNEKDTANRILENIPGWESNLVRAREKRIKNGGKGSGFGIEWV